MHCSRVLFTLVIAVHAVNGSYGHAESIPKSAIAFSTPADVEVYRHYGADMVAWGFAPWRRGPDAKAEWAAKVRAARDAKLKFQARIELDAFWPAHVERIAAPDRNVCRDLDGKQLILPWFVEKTHNGSRAYWYCSNSPEYLEVLKEQVDFVLSEKPDFLMLDAQTSSALSLMYYGGCFCENCLEGFRNFLAKNVESVDLPELKSSQLATFDYGDFLRREGYDCERFKQEYQQHRSSIPLIKQFQKYQNQALNRMSREVFQHAKSLAPKLKISTSSPPYQPLRSTFLPEIDFYTEELHQYAAIDNFSTHPLLCYKICEAAGRPILLTALPFQDWRHIKDYGRIGQVRLWIAQAYANSAIFMVPIRQWTYQDVFLESKPGDYDYLYQFIGRNRELFDGYHPAADVVYLHCTQAMADGMRFAYETVEDLVKGNIPFDLVIVGNELWDYPLDHQRLDAAKAIVTDRSFEHLSQAQRQQLQRYRGKTVRWPNRERVDALTGRQIDVSSGNDSITVFTRKHASRPPVCHLLNRQYLPNEDAMKTEHDFTVRIDKSLCGNARAVTLYVPGAFPREIEIDTRNNTIDLTIPELELWGILSFQP